MKIRKNKNLLILNIIHSLMCVSLLFVTFAGGLIDSGNLFFCAVILIITILAVTGMWLLYCLPTPKAAVILFRIKSIFKVIFIIFVSFIVMILLLAALDCSYSVSGNEDGAPLAEKLKIVIPFFGIVILSVFYLVIYQILLSFIKKAIVNKPIMIMNFIFNVLLCLCAIVFAVSSVLQLLGNEALINIDIVNDLEGISQYAFIILLVLYIGYRGFVSFLLMKNVVKK